MKCLDESELLHLWSAAADELVAQRAHLAECSRCSAGYELIAHDAGLIGTALTAAADHLPHPGRAAGRRETGFIGSLRTAAIFTGAMAFGGAAAFGLMFALGWHLGGVSAPAMATGDGTMITASAADGSAEPLDRKGGALHAAEVITNDPLAGLIYSDSAQVETSNAGEELLFCAPEDDGTSICSVPEEQG